MKRGCELYLKDMLAACVKIESYVAGMGYEAFSRQPVVVDAVLRNLQIIGEAAASLPDEIKTRSPQIPWAKLKAFRNIAVHAYWNVDLETVWDIVAHKLAPLRDELKGVLTGTDPE